MLNNLQTILAEISTLTKRLIPVVSQYIQFLALRTKRHSFKVAAQISGLHPSRFCAFLNDPKAPQLSLQVLNRAARRRIQKLKLIDGRLVILIDATLIGRRGKKVENVQKLHSGRGFVKGHKFVNFVILTPDGSIPLASIPVYSKSYCINHQLDYHTENEIVVKWIEDFRKSKMVSKAQFKKILFIMDSGYDTKKIQQVIQAAGAHFVVALKSNRTVEGKQARRYFNEKRRWLPWQSIRLKVGNGGKKSRRTYSIRTATGVHLKGFGLVTVVCSKATHRARHSTKYLAASDPEMLGRQIVTWYSRRWAIELWHKEMKQNYGYGDCHSSRFTALVAHVNFSLTAYLLQTETGREQMGIEKYGCLKEFKKIRQELTRFGSVLRLKSYVDEAILECVG